MEKHFCGVFSNSISLTVHRRHTSDMIKRLLGQASLSVNGGGASYGVRRLKLPKSPKY